MLVFARESAGQKRQCPELAGRLAAGAAGRGWPVYRTHLTLMSQVAGTCGWGDDALMTVVRRLRDALGPGPGKTGI